MAIKCGSTGHFHETVAQVRACQLGTPVSESNPMPTPADWKPVADNRRREVSEIGARMARSAGIPLSEIEEGRARWATPESAYASAGTAPSEPIRQATITAPARIDRSRTGAGSFASGSARYPAPLASDKQVKYLTDLIRTKEIPEHFQGRVADMTARLAKREVAKREASQFIEALVKLASKPQDTPSAPGQAKEQKAPEVKVDGIYRHPESGEWIKVQWNKAGGDGQRLYAKRLVVETSAERDGNGVIVRPADIRWQYVPGLVAEIKPEWKATGADAAKFGALYGRCQQCRRALTDETSIARAMGPICAGKVAW